ncbi:hypothetical protein IKQ_06062 [Bacillus cereus VDM053]|nr:hypothetical protein IKQ_06062 [Bacillus cereus VDM053]
MLVKSAEKDAYSGIREIQLIQKVCDTRKRLLDALVDGNLEVIFRIESKEMTVSEYFRGMAEHDNHHIKKIKGFLD